MPMVRSKSSGIGGRIPGTQTDFRIGPVFTHVSDEVAEHLRKTVPKLIEFLEKPKANPASAPVVGSDPSGDSRRSESPESQRRGKRRQVEE